MTNHVKRIYVEKKSGFDVEAKHLQSDIVTNLGVTGLKKLRVINRYDISGISEDIYEDTKYTIFSEPPVDYVYDEKLKIDENDKIFAMEYLPGQYDQRADSAAQCIQIFTQSEKPNVLAAKVFVLSGEISNDDLDKIKNYCINPVDSREAILEKPETLEIISEEPADVAILDGFNEKTMDELKVFKEEMGFAMSLEDVAFCQRYFRDTEKRNPTITELKVIDTYWSDHCRHTTFLTKIENVEIEEGKFSDPIKTAYEEYKKSRDFVYGETDRDECLMDIAVIGMKELRKSGKLEDLDASEEINACSIVVDVDIDGKDEEWLVMFKNETHNHPTEIEPFGGAATCLGGCIRDPLSGRSYVYQAMRVTGSADPTKPIQETLSGKLPQRKITTEAAAGYSSYGNQIGLATGQVAEVYDENFVAKRMEVGAVIAAVPKENVVRETPAEGDVIIIVGGRTGRDGCGGATGSSKEHTEESILTCGAEVQKGNAPTERKIQRLFRNSNVSKMIKRCNDFGAGGVSVAIGELTDSLDIDLNKVPKKYEGLDGTELAISESQERMAVVIEKENVDSFIAYSKEENLEATVVAHVTNTGRLRMKWREKFILDISREFLDTNGVKQNTNIKVNAPKTKENFFVKNVSKENVKDTWKKTLKDLNVASQKGLTERFDSTIGGGTVLMPLGGKYQMTPAEGMVAKIPVLKGETNTGTIMTYGYNPKIGKWSPFHGAVYAVLESVTKVVCTGGNYKNIRLSLQEYFEKLGQDEVRWGKPFSALLGAHFIGKKLEIPAIGGKDSMSGTFKDIDVPPTLVSFAVDTVDVRKVVSPEFKGLGNNIVLIPLERDENELPVFEKLYTNFEKVRSLINDGNVLSASSIRVGGVAAAISKMAFGNRIGASLSNIDVSELFTEDYGSIVLEMAKDKDIENLLSGVDYKVIGQTTEEKVITVEGFTLDLCELQQAWEGTLEKVFKSKEDMEGTPVNVEYKGGKIRKPKVKVEKPRVFIPAFPGTNCEYDMAKSFEDVGAEADVFVFRNLTGKDVEESIEIMVEKINKAQIIAIPGGFSAGDEPDGSGKFIATVFRNPRIKTAVMDLLNERDGLMIGICNGFQALIKLGLLPYGEIRDIDETAPTLTFNKIGRHISGLVRTKVASNLSPWLSNSKVGDIHTIAVSHGEGRFIANEEEMKKLIKNGQIATQYVDLEGNPTYDSHFNPNGSFDAVEGITSPDGRIFGKMGHTERMRENIAKNVEWKEYQRIFEAGVNYFK